MIMKVNLEGMGRKGQENSPCHSLNSSFTIMLSFKVM